MSIRRLGSMLLFSLAPACVAPIAWAQSAYPTKPLRFIVAYGPGSTLDIMARTLAPPLNQALG